MTALPTSVALGRVEPATAPAAALERLRAEADHVHRALFGEAAPEEVREQYARVIQAEDPDPDLTPLIERGLDLEALELALRRSHPGNALTRRFHALCYLVEVRPEYFARFVNEPARPVAGALALGVHAIRSSYKLAKGRWLAWIHHVG